MIGSLELGGAELHLTRLVIRLKDEGFSPLVFALSDDGPLKDTLRQHEIVVRAPPHRLRKALQGFPKQFQQGAMAIESFFFLCLALLRHRPHIVHFFLPAAYILGGLAAIVTRKTPRVMSRRSLNQYQDAFFWGRWVEQILHRRMQRICANSQAVFQQLVAEGVSHDRLRLIYNGVSIPARHSIEDRARVRDRLGLPTEAVVIVSVANLIAYKGHKDLLEGLAILNAAGVDNWICLCVGRDDGIGEELHSLAMSAGLSERVRWVGPQTHVQPFLQAADIGVLCSHQEGFSNFVLEGMAAGLAMVVTDVGGNREAIIDGESGRVIPARSPSALAQALSSFITNRVYREALARNAQARVAQHFSQQRCVAAYINLYKELVGG